MDALLQFWRWNEQIFLNSLPPLRTITRRSFSKWLIQLEGHTISPVSLSRMRRPFPFFFPDVGVSGPKSFLNSSLFPPDIQFFFSSSYSFHRRIISCLTIHVRNFFHPPWSRGPSALFRNAQIVFPLFRDLQSYRLGCYQLCPYLFPTSFLVGFSIPSWNIWPFFAASHLPAIGCLRTRSI